MMRNGGNFRGKIPERDNNMLLCIAMWVLQQVYFALEAYRRQARRHFTGIISSTKSSSQVIFVNTSIVNTSYQSYTILHKEVDSFEYVDFPILLHNYVNLRRWSIISFYRNHITSERSFLILSTLIEPQQTGTCSFNNRKRSVKDMQKEFSSIKNITKISYFCGFIKLDSKPASIRIPYTDFNLTRKTMF